MILSRMNAFTHGLRLLHVFTCTELKKPNGGRFLKPAKNRVACGIMMKLSNSSNEFYSRTTFEKDLLFIECDLMICISK